MGRMGEYTTCTCMSAEELIVFATGRMGGKLPLKWREGYQYVHTLSPQVQSECVCMCMYMCMYNVEVCVCARIITTLAHIISRHFSISFSLFHTTL